MSLQTLLFGLFSFIILWNISYWLSLYIKLKKNSIHIPYEFPPVSVVLCSRDHGFELSNKLKKILTQDYPDFEVVVVDDFSSDESKDVLYDLRIQYPHLKPVFLGDMKSEHVNKKDALTTGILFAKNNILLHTDADCQPASDQWIKSMISGYSDPKKQIVLGYGKYEKTKGFLNKIIRYDAFLIALQYLFFSKTGNTYMAVGRNLSYTKDLFRANKGFYTHRKIDSGDDDLFVQANATKENTSVIFHPNSFTISTAHETFIGWILQKIRHTTTSVVYKKKYQVLLFLVSTLKYMDIFYWISIGIYSPDSIWFILSSILLLIRILIQFFVLQHLARSFEEQDLPVLFIIFELLLLFLYPLFIFGKYFTKYQRS